MGLLGIFKKAGKLKKKVEKRGEEAEPVDKSVFRIGVYGHKGVGKTVFFTILYSSSKSSPDFELMALGETQELLGEKFNMMRGQGMDLETGVTIATRRFPPLSTGEQQLNFEVRVGKNTVIPLNSIDYSGELIYIDNRGEIKQKLIDYFINCECVLFFLDPDSIRSEGERSNRIASFTDLIGQLSGMEKKLKIPVGLVVSKADEIPGFKSAEQSILIAKGSGHIRALNFAGFLRGVLKQRGISSRADWKSEIEHTINRLESFFKPLMTRSMDFQVFFISSTGNSPEIITDDSGGKIRIPPEDLRPLGVSKPLRWAISRIRSRRRAAAYRTILKWTFLFVALVIDVAAFGHIYNQMKIRSLFREIYLSTGTPAGINKKIATRYEKYADNFIVEYFFSDFSQKALSQHRYFSTIGEKQARSEQSSDFDKLMSEVDEKMDGLSQLRTEEDEYLAGIAEIDTMLFRADSMAVDLAGNDDNRRDELGRKIETRRSKLENLPTSAEVSVAKDLADEYWTLVKEFNNKMEAKDFDYLLGKKPGLFPDKLRVFKDALDAIKNNPKLSAYSGRIQDYLTSISTNIQQGILIPFNVVGAEGGETGYSISFGGGAGGLPTGNIDKHSSESIRVPLDAPGKYSIDLHKGFMEQPMDSYPVEPGYGILKLHGKPIPFTDQNATIRLHFNLIKFSSYFEGKLQ